jgi:hypothetical protein
VAARWPAARSPSRHFPRSCVGKGNRAALGFGQFPHLDCPHLLRPSSFAAALAYPVRSPIESVPRFPTDIPRNGDAGGSKPIRGSSGQSPVLGARTLTNRTGEKLSFDRGGNKIPGIVCPVKLGSTRDRLSRLAVGCWAKGQHLGKLVSRDLQTPASWRASASIFVGYVWKDAFYNFPLAVIDARASPRRLHACWTLQRHCYAMHGQQLSLPLDTRQHPAREALEWHQTKRFLG